MSRPRIHGEEMLRVSCYLPKRLLVHPENASFSELVYSLLEKYQKEFTERTGGLVPGDDVSVKYNEELELKMMAFFKQRKTKYLKFYNDRGSFDRFKREYPDTKEEEYDLICGRAEKE